MQQTFSFNDDFGFRAIDMTVGYHNFPGMRIRLNWYGLSTGQV